MAFKTVSKEGQKLCNSFTEVVTKYSQPDGKDVDKNEGQDFEFLNHCLKAFCVVHIWKRFVIWSWNLQKIDEKISKNLS